MSVVNPNEHFQLLIVWSTFNIFAACANAILLAIMLISQRWNSNPILVNLELIFVWTCSSGSLLIWTGHALDSDPPYGLCLANASMSMANVPLQAASALAIVLKVWGCVMIACHPRWRPAVEWIIWLPFLIALPFVSGLPLFIIGLVMGLSDRSKIYRGSPFYCVLGHPTVQNASSGFGAVYTFLCLVFAVWTTYNLIMTRWRVRRIIEYPGVSYPFVCRTLFFSIFVGAAFVVGILSLLWTFSAVAPDVVVSSCGVAVFFIFSTARPIIQFVFRCRRVNSVATASDSPGRWPSGVATIDAPQELSMLTFSISNLGGSTASSTLADEPPLWRVKPASTSEFEGGLTDSRRGGHSKETTPG
ncbi:hypothetical protein DFH07DRAFT_795364 [Mycena maculata]|uniref:Uncharacterized protein n=1 Tax=Mycena maculata TaxID=230809 RepID=A0AAD7NX44_9AGAR|nr:hypothetical protein DFH07DRAFT_795364 [Mycena maculata]